MADHKHGEMDIKQNEQTFDGFVRFGGVLVMVVLAVLIFMALVNS